ncbi:phosphorylase family protein [Virgisporangium aurantiacum]|uniref:AAA+ ATPase domain-containing protein n=1 Tax=Virgisporangium aurantiacum TaxID=175570 RepID=A0A8J4E1C5_9ACTN|nr:tetratricopeptide repeat protein [Virgisporangium aurantiacum]GIJ57716.1 hypothetical protein Vau01_052320 [Virgisporangium aurantiacum]
MVVLTALDLEYAAVRERLTDRRRHDHPAGTVFEVGRLPDGSGRIALGFTGEGNTGAAVVADRAIAMFSPRAVFLVGVAGALRDDIGLGDVVVATKVYAYHGGSAQPDGFRSRPRSWEIPHHLDQLARHVYHTGGWATGFPAPPRVHFRPIAAGEVVLNSRTDPLYRHLRETYGDAVAIEMEGAGVAQAAHLNDATPVLVVRGISDRTDGAKAAADDAGWQPRAARHAAAFALAVAAEVGRTTTGSSAVPVSHGLPMSGGLFVGRSTHLTWLDEVLLTDSDRPKVAVLTGMAGVGKTALALTWAHRAAAQFPDGVLHVAARGFGPDPPLTAKDILARFLRALGRERAAERGSVDERSALLRTTLSGRRMLVVVDNAASIEQVRPLLPGTPECAVLITSRNRLGGLAVRHGARILDVDRLSTDQAEKLLSATIGARAAADPDHVTRLAARCAGLPLALRIAAEMVTSRPTHDLAALVTDLTDTTDPVEALDTGDDPHSAVRTVFSWSYTALAPATATAFRRLGLHPGNAFGLPAAAALLDTPHRDTRATLRALTTAHLLIESGPNRWEIHDLLRAYARDLAALTDPEADRSAAVHRMFDVYLHTADAAGRILLPYRVRFPLDGTAPPAPGFTDRRAALRWFDLEHTNLVDIGRIPDPDLDRRRWLLAFTLRDYFFLSKYWDGWIDSHRLALVGCRRLGDRTAEAITRNNLGRALLESGRAQEGELQYTRARHLFEDVDDEPGIADCLINLASLLRHRGEYTAALADQRTAFAVYERHGLPRRAAIALRSIARTEAAQGRLDEAATHATEALDRFVNLDLDMDIAQTLNTLAGIHQSAGDIAAAEKAAHNALDYATRAGSDHERARALHRLGTAAATDGRTDLARRHLTDALDILRRLGAVAADAVATDLADLNGDGC